MYRNLIFLGTNPFMEAYQNSDLFGKLIFVSIVTISIISWFIIIEKYLSCKKFNLFKKSFFTRMSQIEVDPFSVQGAEMDGEDPFGDLYISIRRHALELFQRNRSLEGKEKEAPAFLYAGDLEFLDMQAHQKIRSLVAALEERLFVLSTIKALAPFLGLLGTVWGILTTFSQLQGGTGAGNEAVLSGLSMALATTVLGLLVAIPALIGHSFFLNYARKNQESLEELSTLTLSSIELHYKKN